MEFLNYSAAIARNLGSSPNRGGDIVYYARQSRDGGLVLAPPCLLPQTAKGVMRVQVLRSQNFPILINRSYRAFEGRWW